MTKNKAYIDIREIFEDGISIGYGARLTQGRVSIPILDEKGEVRIFETRENAEYIGDLFLTKGIVQY